MNLEKINNLITEKLYNKAELIKTLVLPCYAFKINLLEYNNIIESDSILSKIEIENEFDFVNKYSLTYITFIEFNNINLKNNILPNSGFLYFFISTNNLGYRFPENKNEFKVIFSECNDFSKINYALKLNNNYIHKLEFFNFFSLPSYQENIYEKLEISEDEINTIGEIQEEVMSNFIDDFEIPHQILGHPNALQGTVRFWWAAQYLKIDTSDQISMKDFNKINEIVENFVLLLQLNFSDKNIGISCFGDSIAYFGIHNDDLKSKNFNNVLLVFQNT